MIPTLVDKTLTFVRIQYGGERPDFDMWPHLLGLKRDGGLVVVNIDAGLMNFKNGMKDMLAQRIIPALIREHALTEVALASPAWQSKREDLHDLELDPARTEVIALWHFTADGSSRFWNVPVERREGQPPALGDPEEIPDYRDARFETYALAALRAARVLAAEARP